MPADNVKYPARIGILLAAAWVDQFSLVEIADEITRSADFLETEQSDRPQHLRSIRAVFDSWHLLDADEQTVLMRATRFQ